MTEPVKIFDIKERTFQFSKDVVLFIKNCKYDMIYFSIFDQVIRSATSSGANVTEGKAGSSIKDFLKFHIIALKSASETIYWLRLIEKALNLESLKLNKLKQEADEISKITASIILKNK